MNNFGKCPRLDQIPVLYDELVPYLIHVGDIVPREIPPASPPYHPKHNPNASCAFHAEYIGHSTKDCWTLKNKIKDMINQKVLSFSKEMPNAKIKPLLNHGGPTINVIIKEETTKYVKRTDDVKTPMSNVLKKHEQFGFLVGIHED